MNTERVQVAATLRRMREEAGLSREQVARVLGCTTSKIGDLETGRSGAKPVELAALLDRYGVTGDERDIAHLYPHDAHHAAATQFLSEAADEALVVHAHPRRGTSGRRQGQPRPRNAGRPARRRGSGRP
ncbi:MAG: helix-turn-helix domain-containing protein, partial [Pseudonocardiaceae bacterium]